ncbi:M20/M25/M40 family metallo-hydrolase [Patulibacter americanus]|uniref:M20/M25/M40 family metallo-hydrolase n=1 Tax=Patulibacter americanus TaxID=588672 RepID=UPI0003B4A787|nr:M20/M25/M40 family metallo-hydrolase [Patulibacter americanus]
MIAAQLFGDEDGGTSAAERERLAELFSRLCAAPSPTGRERACADLVTGVLRGAGLSVTEDDAADAVGGDAGNLLCRIPGRPSTAHGAPSVLLCAHLDTVPVAGRIAPELSDGVWRDALGGVLGADNKATVAALLVLAERLAGHPPATDVELLFTVAEETQLQGAQAVDTAALTSRVGFVIDHPSPLGGIVMAAPGHVRFEAHYRGRAAHAGIAPEHGRSAVRAAARGVVALPQGRVGGGATVNVGHMTGGTPVTNVVPDVALVLGEIRALDEDVLTALVGDVEALLHDAAHVDGESVDLDLILERRFSPYRHAPAAEALALAHDALARIGVGPRPFADGGGSDANVLNARGVATVNLAGGNEAAHEPGERIAASALESTLDLVLALVEAHGAATPAG